MIPFNIRTLCALGMAAALAAGCSTQSPPTTQLAAANAAITDAGMAGATELAPSDLGSARDKLARANSAMAAKDYVIAGRFATEAEADARLAQSKANSTRAQKAADAVQEDIRVLREELNRKTPATPNPVQ